MNLLYFYSVTKFKASSHWPCHHHGFACILWYLLNCDAVDAVWLAGVILHHAAAFITISAEFGAHLRLWRVEVTPSLIFDKSCDGTRIVMNHAGGSISLILFMVMTCIGGVTLVLVPILLLTASQLSRLNVAVQQWGNITGVQTGGRQPRLQCDINVGCRWCSWLRLARHGVRFAVPCQHSPFLQRVAVVQWEADAATCGNWWCARLYDTEYDVLVANQCAQGPVFLWFSLPLEMRTCLFFWYPSCTREPWNFLPAKHSKKG